MRTPKYEDDHAELQAMEYGIRWVEKNSDKYLAKWICFYFRAHPEELVDEAARFLYAYAKRAALKNQILPLSSQKRSPQEQACLKEQTLELAMASREEKGELYFPCVPWLVRLLRELL